MRPYAVAVGEGFIFMHDNVHRYTDQIRTSYLDQQGIDVMDWPSRSFHLTENLWGIVNGPVPGRQPPPHDVLIIRQASVEEWQV